MLRDPKSLGKVAVLFGGQSAETDVSIMSGKGVLEALCSLGVDAHGFDPAKQSIALLKQQQFDRAFIALHGRFGEDGSIQGALELLGIPYTGSDVASSAIAMDKILTKRLWQTDQLPTPQWQRLPSNATDEQLDSAMATLGLPMMLKAPHEGSSLGLAKVSSKQACRAAFDSVAPFDNTILIEQFISGRELTVAVIWQNGQYTALPPIEIIAPQGNYNYQNKYFTDVVRYECPAKLDQALNQQLMSLALKAFASIGCSGWARVDFLLDASNQPYLLEINTAPGMTSHSLVPMAANAAGLSYAQLCFDICSQAKLKIARTA